MSVIGPRPQLVKIMPAIDYYYMSTDGNIPYDGETKDYHFSIPVWSIKGLQVRKVPDSVAVYSECD